MNLDTYDKELLYELDKDSTISIAALAKKLARSKPFVIHRIKRLEERGVIVGYHALLDMSKLGYFTFRIYVDLQNSTQEDKGDIIERCKSYPHVWTISTMSGGWDIALVLGVDSIAKFHTVWDDLKLKFKHKIKHHRIALYAPIYGYNKTFFLSKNRLKQERVSEQGIKEDCDETDWKILQSHAAAARKSSLELARELGISADTIRNRIRKMRDKKIIVGYKLGMDVTKLGYQSYVVDFALNNTERQDALFRFCKMHPSIFQINKTIGGEDFEIEVIVKNPTELIDIIDEIKLKFKDMIRDDNYYLFSSFHVVNYVSH